MSLVGLVDGRLKGAVGGALMLGFQCCADGNALGIGLFTEQSHQFSTNHLCSIGGDQFGLWGAEAGTQWCPFCFAPLLFVDESESPHPIEHIVSTYFRPFGIANGVECRRGLGQSGDHRALCQCCLSRGNPIVGLKGGTDAVATMPQKYLVEIEGQDLFFVQSLLDA